MGGLGDVRSLVVANVWVQGGDEHETLVEDPVDGGTVCLNSSNAVEVEGFASIAEQSNGVQHVADDKRLEDIEFEVAVGASDGDGGVVAHDLSADNSHSLALSWVDLSWHDRRTWLILWKRKFSETTTWARSEEADVVCDFHEGHGERVESSAQVDKGVLAGK